MFILSMSEPVRKADPARGGFYNAFVQFCPKIRERLGMERLPEGGD
jgi:hypothetical protein